MLKKKLENKGKARAKKVAKRVTALAQRVRYVTGRMRWRQLRLEAWDAMKEAYLAELVGGTLVGGGVAAAFAVLGPRRAWLRAQQRDYALSEIRWRWDEIHRGVIVRLAGWGPEPLLPPNLFRPSVHEASFLERRSVELRRRRAVAAASSYAEALESGDLAAASAAEEASEAVEYEERKKERLRAEAARAARERAVPIETVRKDIPGHRRCMTGLH